MTFGKHKGKTLPQIVFNDPDWFFWAYETGVFKGKGRIETEAFNIYQKATSIKIPQNGTERLVAEYRLERGTFKFSNFEIVPESYVPAGTPQPDRKNVIDLSYPSRGHAKGCGSRRRAT